MPERKGSFGTIMTIYLLGLLLGGLYVGIITPARTVIQADFGIDNSVGIWMITIYSLFYAALIPVVGKLADRHGRKLVFCVCMGVFGLGAAICGSAGLVGGAGASAGFTTLLVGRVIQATGACGIIPIANAEIGASAPADKRGFALGLTAATAGIANVLGAAVGSLVIGIVGQANWCWLFYMAIPLCVALIIAGARLLPAHEVEAEGRMDILGSVLMVGFVLLFLLGVQEVDPAGFPVTLADVKVWAPILAGAVLLGAFVVVEGRASDPVFHREYLANRSIVITMAVSFMIGCITVSLTIIPEIAEYILGLPAGEGGYYVIAVGAFSLVGPPLGGKLIDRFGPRAVLLGGLAVSAVGFALVALIAGMAPSGFMLAAGLAFVGLGMGFVMGAPTNYMILENTDPARSSSAVASVALVRQVGTSLAPAVMVSFVAHEPSVWGYQAMLVFVAVIALVGFALTWMYRSPARGKCKGLDK